MLLKTQIHRHWHTDKHRHDVNCESTISKIFSIYLPFGNEMKSVRKIRFCFLIKERWGKGEAGEYPAVGSAKHNMIRKERK